MKIKKLGHCCLVIEVSGLTILTDPGAYTTAQNEIKNIDLILITHEHPDHLHIDSVKQILNNNPEAKLITNNAVGDILSREEISYQLVGHNENMTFNNISIEGFGEKHADVYPSIVPVQNTGYFINDAFFYPGDALFNPGKKVQILGLPVAGPWMKLAEAIDYAKEIKPTYCFPVHDGMLKFLGSVHSLPEKELNSAGISFIPLNADGEHEF